MFQALSPPPSQHVIIEPHPDVLAHMRENGWYSKAGVQILEGRWQDFVNSEDLRGFDVVYTDTFSEDYAGMYIIESLKHEGGDHPSPALREFFGHLPQLLANQHSTFSFFNGLGATSLWSYNYVSRWDSNIL